ncbi:MAG: hypothetical protein KF718_25450 [Polyangiaceae bacterium]|nr:hypothetical protein [Polyangiaceae bacterium]
MASTRLQGSLLVCAATVFVAACWSELWQVPAGTGFGDYQAFHHSWEAALVTLQDFGELPLWNPFQCGGIPDWADPQAQFFHPLFALSFLIGTTLALKVFLLLHALVGVLGQFWLARELGLRRVGAAFAAVSWAGSGYFAWHCGTGHGNFIAFYLAPLVVLCWRRAETDLRYAAALAGLLTSVALAGGAYAFPFFVLLLAFEAVMSLLTTWRAPGARLRLLFAGASVALLCGLMAAVRLVPIVEHLGYYPRVVGGSDAVGLRELVIMLTRSDVTSIHTRFGGHPWVWTEYGAYVGWVATGLGVLGALLAPWLGRGRLLLGATLFGLLTLGGDGPLSPWGLLSALPVFDGLRIPTRFSVLLLLYLTLLAGVALDWLVERLGPARFAASITPWLPHALAAAVTLWTTAAVVTHHRGAVRGMWREPHVRPTPQHRARHFFVASVPRPREPYLQHPAPPRLAAANLGTGYCYTGMAYRPAIGLWPGEVPQVRAVGVDGQLEEWADTPRTVTAVVSLPEGGRLLFNRTFAPGWRSDTGALTIDRGRIAVDLPPGRRRVTVTYAPALWPLGLWMTFAGVVLAAGVLWRGHTLLARPGRALLACLTLNALLVLAYVLAPRYAYERQVPVAFQPTSRAPSAPATRP